MKISTLLLSFCGLSVLYLCYADWIDDLLEAIAEDYLGFDYEEVAPFVPSGAEEFDSIVESLSEKPRNKPGTYFAGAAAASLAVLLLARFLLSGKCLQLIRRGRFKLKSEWDLRRRKSRRNKGEHPGFLSGIFGRKPNRRLRSGVKGDDVPVQVIWKGNGLVESSVHCNLKDKAHREAKAGLRAADFGAGDDLPDATGSSADESTVRRLAEIRKLLDSEPETVQKSVDKSAGTEDFPECVMTELRQRLESDVSMTRIRKKAGKRSDEDKSVAVESEDGVRDQEKDATGDPKLMNRIRLLESRLRLEELKNRNWISRMSRAEGVLQQLNKQVERIERCRPVETALLETLKITSTVTNWMPATEPRRNLQFTLVKQHPKAERWSPRFESLSEYIKREITLPCAHLDPKRFMPVPKPPLVKALPPQPSILSKFLSK